MFLFMGKSLPSTSRLSKIFASDEFTNPKGVKNIARISRVTPSPQPDKLRGTRLELKREMEEGANSNSKDSIPNRFPLAVVVSECAKRWFMDTLKEARAGDTAMQMLVGQMYSSGYGVQKDARKGRAWMDEACKNQSFACEVSDKPQGCNASDSKGIDDVPKGR
ncbi:uncharacterized protein LOC124938498 [Impatiens glandulifera]|uniref:uncharacterized protein LOC124938498 n=1 Tax=Impatiens glandulifera TaxID=253017 RepID=UPI001FB0ACA2|nr:uncharacterized protein LOC124938498 [Impatiens glandulifera]